MDTTAKKRTGVFVVLLFASMVGGLAQTIANTALPSIMQDMGLTVMVGQWLVTGYILAFCVATPLFAAFVKRLGIGRLYAIALFTFLLGSACCAFAPSFALLFFGRILQGAGASLVMPLSQCFVFSEFPAEHRGALMGVVGLSFSFTPSIGPTLAGALTTLYGWRSCYALLMAVSVVCLLAGWIVLFRRRSAASGGHGSVASALQPPRVDMPTVILSSLGFGGLLLGISDVSGAGIASWTSWGPLVVGAIATVGYFLRLRTADRPMIDLGVCRSRKYLAGVAILCSVNASFIGFNLIIPLGLQEVRGLSALDSGLVLLPSVLASLVASPLAGWAQDRFGSRPVSIVAGSMLTLGTIALIPMAEEVPLVWVSVWQVVRCLGLSPLITTVNTWSLGMLPLSLTSDGVSFTSVFRQLASAFGTTVLTLVVAYVTAWSGLEGEVSAVGIGAATAASALFCAATLGLVLAVMRGPAALEAHSGH